MRFVGELSDHFDLHSFLKLTSSPLWTMNLLVPPFKKNATFAPFQVLALLLSGEQQQEESWVLIGRQCLNLLLLLLLLNSRPSSPVSRAATVGERARETCGKRSRARKFVWTRDYSGEYWRQIFDQLADLTLSAVFGLWPD